MFFLLCLQNYVFHSTLEPYCINYPKHSLFPNYNLAASIMLKTAIVSIFDVVCFYYGQNYVFFSILEEGCFHYDQYYVGFRY